MNRQQQKALAAKAHSLKPVVLLGAKGLTDAVLNEIDIALDAHELIKIKLSGCERDEKQALVESICGQLEAEKVQIIGNIATVYRLNPDK